MSTAEQDVGIARPRVPRPAESSKPPVLRRLHSLPAAKIQNDASTGQLWWMIRRLPPLASQRG
ncbi:hypothetical protein J1614_009315 [Plenodomus biglobosus]|nr:hypothetical protein J1614_009315 [Plenodomus biglobosus]